MNQAQLSISNTVAFNGVEVVPVEVQVSIGKGMPGFVICGLPDKAINESKDRIRSALTSLGIALPAKRIVVNMSPANIPKEGSHYDLPITLGLLQAIGILPSDSLLDYISIGELALNSNLTKIPGALISAVYAFAARKKLICPYDCGGEAACGGDLEIVAASNLMQVINHLTGKKLRDSPKPQKEAEPESKADMSDIIGNQSAKRALEIAAAGGHHMLMIGSPGVGKSMLAMRLPGILPQLSTKDALEVSMIHSVAGLVNNGLITRRPFREPHHNSSTAAILGGGRECKPGEISLAHRGVLFLDEITLWSTSVLNGLRESLETGSISVARANAHVKYPAQYQLIAAMNPCPCGKAYEPDVHCTKLPHCVQNYMNRIPGPILDRFGIVMQVSRVNPWDRDTQVPETSAIVRRRVEKSIQIQRDRQQSMNNQNIPSNADQFFLIEDDAAKLLDKTAAAKNLSNRKYYNAKRIARSIADLAASKSIQVDHVLEALTYVGAM